MHFAAYYSTFCNPTSEPQCTSSLVQNVVTVNIITRPKILHSQFISLAKNGKKVPFFDAVWISEGFEPLPVAYLTDPATEFGGPKRNLLEKSLIMNSWKMNRKFIRDSSHRFFCCHFLSKEAKFCLQAMKANKSAQVRNRRALVYLRYSPSHQRKHLLPLFQGKPSVAKLRKKHAFFWRSQQASQTLLL